MAKPLIVILGQTASGKTSLGVFLAKKFNGEIISADSRQVYKGMDIGTGKDLKEYKKYCPIHGPKKTKIKTKQKICQCIPYHLIDVVSPKQNFSVAWYQKLAFQAIENILKKGKIPFLVGGTGLYLQAVTEGLVFPKAPASKKIRQKLAKMSLPELLEQLKKLDPQTFQIIDQKNRRRIERALEIILLTKKPLSSQRKKNPPPYQILKIGLKIPKEKLHQKIKKRLKERLEKEGLIEEVKRLHKQGISWKRLEDFGLEYRYLNYFLQNKMSYEQMFEALYQAIKDFAKRQMVWFKRDKEIHWLNNKKEAEKLVKNFLKKITEQ